MVIDSPIHLLSVPIGQMDIDSQFVLKKSFWLMQNDDEA